MFVFKDCMEKKRSPVLTSPRSQTMNLISLLINEQDCFIEYKTRGAASILYLIKHNLQVFKKLSMLYPSYKVIYGNKFKKDV